MMKLTELQGVNDEDSGYGCKHGEQSSMIVRLNG